MFGWKEPQKKTLQVFKPKAQGSWVRVYTSEAMPIRHRKELAGEGSPSNPYTTTRRISENSILVIELIERAATNLVATSSYENCSN